MAIINIQEILHPSDSDSIKFDKINYNFDQIVAAGGGPKGPLGPKGPKGDDGLEGQVGAKGDKGEQGETGATTSPWKTISIDLDSSDGVNDYSFLKPKPSTDKESPIIWLGDAAFTSSADGEVGLRSTLNVGRHYNFNTSSVTAGYMTFYHSSTRRLEINSEDDSNGYVLFNVNPLTDQPLDPTPDIRLNFNTKSTVFSGALKLANYQLSGLPEEDGMIRYNPGGSKFEGYIGGQWVEFCQAPCGTGSGGATIDITPEDDITVNEDGTPQVTFTFSDWTGSIAVDATGTIAITDGNSSNVTTDQANFPANTDAGDNTLTVDVNVEVPAGFSNTGDTVEGQVSVTQPTSYTAPLPTTTTAAPTTTTTTSTTTTTTTAAPTTTTTTTTAAPVPTYDSFTLTPTTADEGDSVTATIQTSNVPDGTNVWVGFGVGVTSPDDFSGGGIDSGSGTGDPYGGSGTHEAGLMIQINSNSGSSTFTVVEDNQTEGTENFTLTLFATDSAGNSTGSLSAGLQVNDTSVSIPTYTITYNANGGTGSMTPTIGQLPLTVANNGFSRAGWTFNQWNTSQYNSGTAYDPGDTYNSAANVTLYANWAQNTTTTTTTAAPNPPVEHQITNSGNMSGYITFTNGAGATTGQSIPANTYSPIIVCAIPGTVMITSGYGSVSVNPTTNICI